MEDLIILHEDNHIIVVLKPQNMPSCEDSSKDLDLLTALKEMIKVRDNKPGNVYLGLVHRLDRPTGGIMVFAKTSKAAERLSTQIKNGDFQKKYHTVLVGSLPKKQQTLTNYLKKNPINNMVYVCGETVEGAKFSKLDYKVLEEKTSLSFIKEHSLTPSELIDELKGFEHFIFRNLYAGKTSKKIYKMYEYRG